MNEQLKQTFFLKGKQLLPLSTSMHSGVAHTLGQPSGESSNLVRMRNQSLGQSAPSLTAGLVCFNIFFYNFIKAGYRPKKKP